MLLKFSSALGYLANPAFSLKPTGSDNSKTERIRTMERRLKNYLLYCYPMWKKKKPKRTGGTLVTMKEKEKKLHLCCIL